MAAVTEVLNAFFRICRIVQPPTLSLPIYGIRYTISKAMNSLNSISLRKVLYMVAVSKKDLDHWNNTNNAEWEKHVKVMINRFHHSNINAGLILATAAVLLSSDPPLSRFLAYDNPAAYISATVAFCAALLNVIFGAAIIVMYESGIAQKDMNKLKEMAQWRRTRMLVWLAGPPIYMMISTISLFLSTIIACFFSEYTAVKVIGSLVIFAFLCSFILTLSIIDDDWSESNTQPNGTTGHTLPSTMLVGENNDVEH